jgi:two-component system cell cycle sensor histidine kinase/response regulator CckA
MQEQSLNEFTLKSLPPFNFNKKMRPKEYDLNEIIMELEALLPEHIHKGISTKITKTGKELKVLADVAKMKEALINLIRNASDAMPSGGMLTLNTEEVHFGDKAEKTGYGHASGKCALVSIVDTGSGMDESIRERMHEPYFTTREGKRGLGFPVASHVIEQHHGSIRIDSVPGAGTTVNVYLPLLNKGLFHTAPIPLPSSFSKNNGLRYGSIPSKNEIFL